jgi:hypothetical protein
MCTDSIHDPVLIGVRDASFDAARSPCVRSEVIAYVGAHATIDTPNFYGQIGSDVAINANFAVTRMLELGFSFRALNFEFAQNAVTKASDVSYGPLSIHAKAARTFGPRPLYGAVLLDAALPYTNAELQPAVFGGQLSAVMLFAVNRSWFVHSRVGLLMGATSSAAGSTLRAAGRAGVDINFNARRSLDVAFGLEVQAGWYRAFDHLMPKASVHWRVAGRWRLTSALGVPLLGDERRNAVFTLGVGRDL